MDDYHAFNSTKVSLDGGGKIITLKSHVLTYEITEQIEKGE